MWGLIGFSFATAVFLLFGHTAYRVKIKKTDNFIIKHYVVGIVLAASACALWAATSLIGSASFTSVSIIVGDILLVLATLYLLNAWIDDDNRLPAIIGVGMAGILLVLARIFIFKPDAYILDGVLVFNTPRVLAIVLIAMLFSIWFYANYRFYSIVAPRVKSVSNYAQSTFFLNVMALVGISGFLVARKPFTIVASFVLFVVAYAVLSLFNYIASKGVVVHGK